MVIQNISFDEADTVKNLFVVYRIRADDLIPIQSLLIKIFSQRWLIRKERIILGKSMIRQQRKTKRKFVDVLLVFGMLIQHLNII